MVSPRKEELERVRLEVGQVLLRGHGQGRGSGELLLNHGIGAPAARAGVQGLGDHPVLLATCC